MGFGSQFYDKWKGQDLNYVAELWAEKLEEFSLGAIGYAIDKSLEKDFPPNIGEFMFFCRDFKPPVDNILKITKKLSEEDKARNRERLKKISEMLAKKVTA